MIEIDFDRVDVRPAEVEFYKNDDRPVGLPPMVAVRCLNPEMCRECKRECKTEKVPGLIAWLTLRDNPQSPTEWIVLCDEHLAATKRPLPAGLD